MAAAVTKLEIGVGIDSSIPEFAIGYNVTAGRVDIAKRELSCFQVAKRMDRRTGFGYENGVILPIGGALHQWDDSIRSMSPYISHATQPREIVRAVRQMSNGVFITLGNLKIHRPSHCLDEILA